MKEFCDVLWEKGYAKDFNTMKLFEDKYICYMAHIPAFLNQKQYDALCYKYFKRQMTAIDAQNSKLYILAEGKWEHLFDFMLDLPKAASPAEVEAAVRAQEQTAKYVGGGQIAKVIVVPGRIINIVVK